jgi:hypothetical protein
VLLDARDWVGASASASTDGERLGVGGGVGGCGGVAEGTADRVFGRDSGADAVGARDTPVVAVCACDVVTVDEFPWRGTDERGFADSVGCQLVVAREPVGGKLSERDAVRETREGDPLRVDEPPVADADRVAAERECETVRGTDEDWVAVAVFGLALREPLAVAADAEAEEVALDADPVAPVKLTVPVSDPEPPVVDGDDDAPLPETVSVALDAESVTVADTDGRLAVEDLVGVRVPGDADGLGVSHVRDGERDVDSDTDFDSDTDVDRGNVDVNDRVAALETEPVVVPAVAVAAVGDGVPVADAEPSEAEVLTVAGGVGVSGTWVVDGSEMVTLKVMDAVGIGECVGVAADRVADGPDMDCESDAVPLRWDPVAVLSERVGVGPDSVAVPMLAVGRDCDPVCVPVAVPALGVAVRRLLLAEAEMVREKLPVSPDSVGVGADGVTVAPDGDADREGDGV